MSKRKYHIFPNNFSKNKVAFKNNAINIRNNNSFIEDQQNYNVMSFVIKSLLVSDWVLISIYNVLFYLTKKEDINLTLLIRDLEYDGIIFWRHNST